MFLGFKQTTCWKIHTPYQINHRDGAWRLTSTYWNHRDTFFLRTCEIGEWPVEQKPQTQSLTVFLNLFVFRISPLSEVVANKIKPFPCFCEFYRHSMAFPLGFGPLWGTPFPPPSTGPYDCSELCGFSSLEVQAISGCRGDILSKGTRPTNFVEAAYCNHCGKFGHHCYGKSRR